MVVRGTPTDRLISEMDAPPLAGELDARGIGLVSLSDSIDTTTATGRLFFTIAAAFAEFEGNVRRERQEAAWASGKQKGRPPTVHFEQLALAQKLQDGVDEPGHVAGGVERPGRPGSASGFGDDERRPDDVGDGHRGGDGDQSKHAAPLRGCRGRRGRPGGSRSPGRTGRAR